MIKLDLTGPGKAPPPVEDDVMIIDDATPVPPARRPGRNPAPPIQRQAGADDILIIE